MSKPLAQEIFYHKLFAFKNIPFNMEYYNNLHSPLIYWKTLKIVNSENIYEEQSVSKILPMWPERTKLQTEVVLACGLMLACCSVLNVIMIGQ